MTLNYVEENTIFLTEQENLLRLEILGLWMSIFLKSAWQILERHQTRKGNVTVATEKGIGLKNALQQQRRMDLQFNKEKHEKEKEKGRIRKEKGRRVLKEENLLISGRVKKKDLKKRKKQKRFKLKKKKRKTNWKLIAFIN